MLGSDAASESTVLPGFVQMEMRIVLPGIVPDPLAIGVDVRSFGMAWLVRRSFGFLLRGSGLSCGGRSLGRNVAAADLSFAAFMFFAASLGKRRNHREDPNR